MENPDPQCQYYRVGDYFVEINAAQVITPDGRRVMLKDKALKTLQVFLEHPNQYFTNEQLIERVYDTISISTSTIAQNMKQLRKTFNDKDKLIFENRLKFGYRLTLPVSVEQASDALPLPDEQGDVGALSRLQSESQSRSQSESQSRSQSESESRLQSEAHLQSEPHSGSQSRTVALGVFATLLLILFAAGYWWKWPVLAGQLSQRPLTHSKGQEYFPSLSQDGQWLVYSHRTESTPWSLQLRNMRSGQIVPLLSDPDINYKHGQITRDGQRLIFTQLSSAGCELMEAQFDATSMAVSHLRRLTRCEPVAEGARISEGMLNDQYIYSNASAIDAPFSLYSFSTVTAHSEQLTAPPASGRGDYFMRLSPDRKQLAFLRDVEPYVTEIRLLDLDSRNDVLLDTVDTTLFTVNWSWSGDALIYKDTANQVVALDWRTKQRSVIKQARLPIYAPFALSADNQRIGLIGGSLVDHDIAVLDFNSLEKSTLLDSSFADSLPVYAPAKNRLAWVSNRSGIFQIWLKEGDQLERVLTHLEHNGRFTSLDFSADGNKLGGTFDGQWFTYDIDSEQISWSRLSDHRYTNFAWQQGAQSAYVLDTFGHNAIMKRLDTSEGTTDQFSRFPDAYLVKESPDGKWLFAWFKHSHRFIRINQQTDEVFEISTTNETATSNQWAISNQQIIWVDHPQEGPSFLRRLDHQQQNASQIGEAPYFGTITVSPHELSVILTVRAQGSSELIEI